MKRRWIIAVSLLALGALCVLLFWSLSDNEQRAVAETRRALRAQGFKTDLADFNLSASDDLRARATVLTRGEFSRAGSRDQAYGWRFMSRTDLPDLMAAVGADAALVVWKQPKLVSYHSAYGPLPEDRLGEDLWPALREMFTRNAADVDSACSAALAGPIRFNLVASHGSAMLLPHLAALRSLGQVLGTRTVLELHDGRQDVAWTNLMASTRLVTAWDPEPADVSQMVRFACSTIAFNLAWQALQADGWGDNRLANLQREWEAVDFFKCLPETAAFARASSAATCQLERQQPLSAPSLTTSEVFNSARAAWYGMMEYWRRVRYRQHGSYEDEKALLLFYRDREVELRRAVQAPSWLEMRQLPGVTNAVAFQSRHFSRMQMMLNTRRMSMNLQGRGRSLLGQAAEAEARRRLIVTAIALERYRGRHGAYPATLRALVPELLPKEPRDFMDGEPLRYRVTGDAHFVLYSVGLDGVDNGGAIERVNRRRGSFPDGPQFGFPQDSDLVWPRPASAQEAELQHQAEKQAVARERERVEEMQADYYWRRTASRQAKAEALLQTPQPPMTNEPAYQGALSEVLRNRATSGTNHLSLGELLTLRQVTAGAEPEIATFELPIKYDVLTNLGSLHLFVDFTGREDEDSDLGFEVAQSECERATNGNCRLMWNTIYEAPGPHTLQAGLLLEGPEPSGEDSKPPVVLDSSGQPLSEAKLVRDVSGPAAAFVVSNLCQFSLGSAYFKPEFGITLRAKLPEPNGRYRAEIKLPSGDVVKTLTGSTSNGVIKVYWDVTDERGMGCTNQSYGSLFQIVLPDSGRSRTMKGP